MKANPLQSRAIQLLGVQIIVHSDTPRLLSEVHRRFGLSDDRQTMFGPIELTAMKDADRFRVLLEGREERLRLAERWPRLDDLVQLIIQRERSDLAFIHGACVAARNKAALLFGSSTAGKTTLGLALRQRGFDLLAEDTTPVFLEKGLVYPFLTSLNLREHTARLADEQEWDCNFVQGETASFANGIPLHWIIYVTPKTLSRTTLINTDDLAEWERFRRLTGAPPQARVSSQDRELAIRTQADFDCRPEMAPIRQSQLARELLRHGHLSAGMELPAVLQAVTALIRQTHAARLVPGHLAQTVDLLQEWMLPSNPATP
jgi:hypothetical protein